MKFVFKTLFLVLFSFGLLFSQTKQPVKEVRAVWVATVPITLDWPTTSGAENQKNETIRILDGLKANNFNTVVLQVRSRGDLMYSSKIEPWAISLTGSLGRYPGYDPLQFWIEETHKRGMELHAWWNFAYLATEITVPTSEGLPHVGTVHPEWVKVAGGMFMDVGYPQAREYLVNLAMEMVNNYDIDAIHFDYIRYNENINNAWDQATYNTYNPNNLSRGAWRRENINQFVRAIYDSVKAVKPWVKVGSAPYGSYQTGLSLYCESRRWLIEGKHDYLAPMMYEPLYRYYPLLVDWMDNTYGRHIWGGVGTHMIDNSQLADIVDTTRALQASGNIFFRLRVNLERNNYANIKSVYQYPANIPAMPWLDSIPPATPKNLTITKIDDKTFRLRWDRSELDTDGDATKYYNIYRSTSSEIDYEDGANLYHITTNSDNIFTISFDETPTRNYYFTVTALDRGNVESAPSNMVQSTEAVEAGIVATNSNIDWGYVPDSSSGDIRTLKITNAGSIDIDILSLEFTGENANLFSFTSIPDLPLTIAPSESVELSVQIIPKLSPEFLGIKTANIVIEHNSSVQPSEIVTLIANVLPPEPVIIINLLDIAFGGVNVGDSLQKYVKITNGGYEDLVISSVSISGAGFILPNKEQSITVQRGSSYELLVRFLPTAITDYNGSITLTHNQATLVPDQIDRFNTTIQLSGKGLEVISVDDLEQPTEFKLEQNYPNPFNPTTNIVYHIPLRANVTLSIYNILGQEVSVLVNEVKDAGNYLVNFDASNLSTGVYIYKINVSTSNKTFVDNKKMLLMK